jgi:ABC-type thiamine transport system substrate-binding protein
MKTSLALRKCFVFLSTFAVVLLIGSIASAQTQTNQLRVGVYDSRAVAVAYSNSTEFKEAMKLVEAEFKKARACHALCVR